jgi:MFS family permease
MSGAREVAHDPDAHLRWLLPVSVFAAGGAVMVVELAGPRMVEPGRDAAASTWTAMIAVTLVALALGSWLGGRWADRAPEARRLFSILGAAALLVGLVPLASGPLAALTASMGARAGTLAAAGALFLLPLTLLGMIPPFAVRLATRHLDSLGGTAGRLGATSTLGSLAGTLLAGFVPVREDTLPLLLVGSAFVLVVLVLLHPLLRVARHRVAAEGVATSQGLTPDPWGGS